MSDKLEQLSNKLSKDMSSAIATKPTPVSYDTVSVDISASMSDTLSSAYVVATRTAIGSTNCDVDVDATDFTRYVNYLVRTRVAIVNGERVPREVKYLSIPCVLALALLHVGRCTDAGMGITLVPTCSICEGDCMTLDEAIDFSNNVLSYAELGGLKCVQGIPRNTEGHLETMYFNWIEDRCCAHVNNLSIGSAALSCFFKAKHLESLVSSRIVYGYGSELEAALRGLIISS